MIELIDLGNYDELLRREFIDLLARARLTKSGLARNLDLNRITVSRWGRKLPIPGYALAYLRLYVIANEIEQLCYQVRDEFDNGEHKDMGDPNWSLGAGFACNLLGKKIHDLWKRS